MPHMSAVLVLNLNHSVEAHQVDLGDSQLLHVGKELVLYVEPAVVTTVQDSM